MLRTTGVIRIAALTIIMSACTVEPAGRQLSDGLRSTNIETRLEHRQAPVAARRLAATPAVPADKAAIAGAPADPQREPDPGCGENRGTR